MTVTTTDLTATDLTATDLTTTDLYDRPVTVGADDWTVIAGLPGVWRRIRTRVAVSARASDGVLVDGRRLDGLQVLRSDADLRPSEVTVGPHVLRVTEGSGNPVLRVGPA